ncbi:MAG: AraC family transcriptional regulator [Gammaproteobacteria bacterium]|nr:AraC family transcriptional regulator [Gammaproteobacteria bacterium]
MSQLNINAESYNESVPLEFTRALLAQLRAYDKDVAAILREARFPFDPLTQDVQTMFVSREQYSRLCVELFRAIGDESGGVMPDVRTPPGTMRLIALSMINSANLAAALKRAIEFNAVCRVRQGAPVVNQVQVDEHTREASLTYFSSDDDPRAQHGVLCSLGIWLRFCGWLIGQHIDITEAGCAGPRPDFTAGVRHFFQCPVRYDQAVNSVSFSARHLEVPIIRDEEQLEAFLKLAPYHLVIEPQASTLSITHRIREILGDDFRREMPSFEELTELLHMSARTLRRRLEREGTSYQRIKDNARRDVAISLLSRDGLTVSQVAEKTGFSDPSAFHRSFKKWTGQSPGSYR